MVRRVALHLTVLVLGAAVLRVGVVPAEVCPVVTAVEVRAAIDEATAWIGRGMSENGRYTYGYDRGEDAENRSYNSARHAGVTMALYQVALEHDPAVLLDADRGLAYMLERVVEHDDWAAWTERSSEVELGPNGLFLAALSLRRESTGDGRYDELMRSVGRFVLVGRQSDGSMYAYWDRHRQQPIPLYAAFATGQAAWALLLLDHHFPGEGWAEAALPTLSWIAGDRDRVEGRIARLPDHWAAYALEALPAAEWSDEHVVLARRLAGYFGMRLRFESQRRGDGINLAVRWFPGPPAGVGTAGEGIGALWRLSATAAGLTDLRPNMEDRLACTAGMMVGRQVTAAEAQRYGSPGLAGGAWFYRGYTQMDDQQHVISALLAALPVVEAREVSE